jgi:nitroreductase
MVEGAPYGGYAAQAPATVVPAVDLERASGSWGEQEKAVWFPVEVGFLTQTMRLAATAADLSFGIVGGFGPVRIKKLFGIKEGLFLLLPFGCPL